MFVPPKSRINDNIMRKRLVTRFAAMAFLGQSGQNQTALLRPHGAHFGGFNLSLGAFFYQICNLDYPPSVHKVLILSKVVKITQIQCMQKQMCHGKHKNNKTSLLDSIFNIFELFNSSCVAGT